MFNINLKASGMDLTDSIRSYVESKLRGVEKFTGTDEESLSADVEVAKETAKHKGEHFRAEINFHIAGVLRRVEATEDDLYAAIDKAKDELVRKLSEGKSKSDAMRMKGWKRLKDKLLGR